MTNPTATLDPVPGALDPAFDVRVVAVSRRRRVADRLASVAMWAAMAVALVPLVAVLVVLVQKGARMLDWHFLTADIPHFTNAPELSPELLARFGLSESSVVPAMGPAVVGTLLTTAVAAALAIPIGVLGAIYLNEYGGRSPLARVIRLMSDVMTGVPSIVMGLFIYNVWVLRYGASGFSATAGGLALGCLMLPIVVRSSEEMLRLVPDELRRSSLALGGRRWHTVLRVVLPAALPGVVSGAMLAVARAAGETAPVLFTVGTTNVMNASLQGGNTTLAAQIFSNAKTTIPSAQAAAWGAALTLVLLVFVLTAVARLVSSRFATNLGG